MWITKQNLFPKAMLKTGWKKLFVCEDEGQRSCPGPGIIWKRYWRLRCETCGIIWLKRTWWLCKKLDFALSRERERKGEERDRYSWILACGRSVGTCKRSAEQALTLGPRVVLIYELKKTTTWMVASRTILFSALLLDSKSWPPA